MSTVKREFEKAPIIPQIKPRWKPNVIWRLFTLIIYGGVKLPMAEQDSSSKPPIVQWPVFLFIFSLVILGATWIKDSGKDASINAATQATILEKLNTIDSSIKSNREFSDFRMKELEERIKGLEGGMKSINTLVGLEPNIIKERQQQQLNESKEQR